MSTIDLEYWKRIAAENHAKLVEAREALARANSGKHEQYVRERDALRNACVEARAFVTAVRRGAHFDAPWARAVSNKLDAALALSGVAP